jgi:CHAT domain-containing protein
LLVEGKDAQSQDLMASGTLLSRALLEPAAPLLGQKRLVVVADGPLQYLPFAALPDPNSLRANHSVQPLIAQHEIVSLPSISVLATIRSETKYHATPSGDLAVLADPVFDPNDKRVRPSASQPRLKAVPNSRARRRGEDLNPLPGTRREAEQITAFLPAGRFRKALDFEATRQLAIGGDLSRYRYLHFATHGLVDSMHPELTALVFSLVDEDGNPQDGYLRAHEIYNLHLSADLVVLSACKTALGKEISGEGLISLTRGFMYAGAPRVVASLWRVDDDSPAELMKLFYQGMIEEGKPPAAALRAAQLELLKSPRWQAPHYWAAFVLQGEWR